MGWRGGAESLGDLTASSRWGCDEWGTQAIRGLGLEGEGVLLNDGVDEDLAGDAVDLSAGVFTQGGVEREDEILPLAHIFNAGILHATKRAGDGLALGVENGALQRDIDMGLHAD